MKRIVLVFIALVISLSFLYSIDFADNYISSINNIFDAYEATVIVKRVTAADSVMGTGFFVSEDYLVTNASTVGTSQYVKVNIRDNDYDAYVVAVHYFLDFALLKVDGFTSFRTFTFERYNSDMMDNRGTVLNYPEERIMETHGAILTNSQIYDNDALFQIDISMPKGRVDGPILNSENRLIGFLMGNNITRDYIDTKQYIPNSVYLAVKSDYIIPILQIYTKIAIHYKTPEGGITNLTPDPGLVLASKAGGSGLSSSVIDRPLISVGVYDDQKLQLSSSEAAQSPTRPPLEPIIAPSQEEEEKAKIDNSISNLDIGEDDIPDREKERRERAEKERAAREKLARERVQTQRIQQENDDRTRLDKERDEREQAIKDRLIKEQNEARERQDRERVEREQAEINRINREKILKLQAENDQKQREQDRLENERIQAADRARSQRELEAQNERLSRERIERDQAAQRERERQEQIQAAERERAERDRQQNEPNLQNNTRDNVMRRQ